MKNNTGTGLSICLDISGKFRRFQERSFCRFGVMLQKPQGGGGGGVKNTPSSPNGVKII